MMTIGCALPGPQNVLCAGQTCRWFLSQLTLLVKVRERGRTSFWWPLLQEKRSMPALTQLEQRWVVSTPQTSHGCATGSVGMLEGLEKVLCGARCTQRCGSMW